LAWKGHGDHREIRLFVAGSIDPRLLAFALYRRSIEFLFLGVSAGR
jgi:hypothetical protein